MENITLPLSPRVVSQEGSEATFVIEDCFPGYGMTLGNSLQRVLLSSLPGAAVVAARIEGADHEFMALPGVREDVITILLNLKKVRFSFKADGTVRGALSVKGGKGEKLVKAGDLEFPSDVKIINPTAPIATLTSPKAALSMEVVVESGLGYRTAAENKLHHTFESGMMAIDSIFSPVLKINYKVEDMRVGERTDFNRLTFLIKTDGSISPQEAITSAAKILVSQFTELSLRAGDGAAGKGGKAAEKAAGKAGKKKADADAPKTPDKDVQTMLIGDLKLSSRIGNILEEQGLKTVGDLAKKGEDGIAKVPGIGDKAVKEIRRKLGRLGIILSK